VKKISSLWGRQTKNIYLYEIIVHDHVLDLQYPIAHMLSEQHDNSISHWLRDVGQVPKIVITDQSIALMSAVVRAFTRYTSLNVYLQVCASIIDGQEIASIISREMVPPHRPTEDVG
jgi:hypothetical protein